jgi:putative addiction module CopG family antidote
MNVSLSSELERFVHQCVEKGNYKSASEVVREALRLLRDVQRERYMREATEKVKCWELEREWLKPLFEDDLKVPSTPPKERKRRKRT